MMVFWEDWQAGRSVRLARPHQPTFRLLLLSLLLLAGVAPSHAQILPNRWIRPFQMGEVCPRIAAPSKTCTRLAGGAHGVQLRIKQAIRNATGSRLYFQIETPDGLSGFMESTDEALTAVDPATAFKEVFETKVSLAQPKKCDEPKLGMTRADVLTSCWGAPLETIATTTLNGVHEDMIYSATKAVRLTNAVVTVIVK